MPNNNVNASLTDLQKAAIQAAIDELENNLPVKINLTKKEIKKFPTINNRRLPYATKAIKNYGPSNPKLISGFAGSLEDANKDLDLFLELENYIVQLKGTLEMYKDLQHVVGYEVFMWFREFYRSSQSASKNQYAGADSIVDDLKPIFGKNKKTPSPKKNLPL